MCPWANFSSICSNVPQSVLSVQPTLANTLAPAVAAPSGATPSAASHQWFTDRRAPILPSPPLREPQALVYWCAGVDRSQDSIPAQWTALTGQPCVAREKDVSWEDSLLRDVVYNTDLGKIKEGVINRGLFSPPCGTFCVSRFRPHPRVRVPFPTLEWNS